MKRIVVWLLCCCFSAALYANNYQNSEAQLASKKISSIIWPGTHDSGSYGITPDSPLYDLTGTLKTLYQLANKLKLPVGKTVAAWSVTQKQNFYQQLNSGIRYLDIRSCYYPQNKQVYLCHDALGQLVDTALIQVASFAKTHPQEIILLDFSQLKQMNAEQEQQYALMIKKILGPYLVSNQIAPDPTVTQVLATKHNVIAFYNNTNLTKQYNFIWSDHLIWSQWANAIKPQVLYNTLNTQIKNYQNVRTQYPFFNLGAHLTHRELHYS